MKILEDSMDREEEGAFSDDVEDLRKKLAEAEKKNLRVASDVRDVSWLGRWDADWFCKQLNKEISELEALVESKIYREVSHLGHPAFSSFSSLGQQWLWSSFKTVY